MTKRKRIPEYLRSSKSVYVPGKKPPKKSNDVFARTGAALGASAGIAGASNVFAQASAAGLSPAAVTGMFTAASAAEAAIIESAMVVGTGVGVGAAVAAAVGAGYIVGSITDAAAAAILANMDVDSVFSQTNNPVLNIMSGYGGKFAMSAKKSSKGLRDKFQKKGAVYITENYGSLADPNVVYIGQSTYNIDCIVSCIAAAILRKLFRVGAKLDQKTVYEELPLVAANPPDSGPDGYKIVYFTQDSDGTQATFLHTIPNDQSIHLLATRTESAFRLIDNIRESMVVENPKVLQKVMLFQNDKDGASNHSRLVYSMDLNNEVLDIAMSTHMVIQNRTKSATGGSSEITVVDSQPLKGPVFEFSSGVPKLKAETPLGLNVIRPSGLILVRAGELSGTDVISFIEPPVKALFNNVVKSGYVRLGAGTLKSMSCGAGCKGFYAAVLFKLRYNNDGGITSRAYGKSQLLCLEEELNSGSANNITLSYESQHIAGCDLTTTFSPNMQPGYSALEINNVPA
jgi:hypothetical protein